MKKGFAVTTIIIIIVLAVIAFFINNTKSRMLDSWQLLPDTPVFVIETQNPTILFEKLKYGNDIWNSLTKINSFKNIEVQTDFLDSLLKQKKSYHTALFYKPLLIAFYGDSITAQTLFVSSIGNTPNIENIKQFLTEKVDASLGFISKSEGDLPVFKIIKGSTDFSLTVGFAGNMMVASQSESLVLKAVETFNNKPEGHFVNNNLFVKIKQTAGKHINTHLYINGASANVMLKQFVNSKYEYAISQELNTLTWSESDLFLKKNELILNGLSIGSLDNADYQKLLNQKPQRQDYIGNLPYNTTLFLFKGFSDFKNNNEIKNNHSGIDLETISKMVGNQVVFVSTARSEKEIYKKSFAVIRFLDKAKANHILLNAAKKSGKLTVKTYDQYVINKLKKSNFISVLFGSFFRGIQENYYLFIDDYAIFGNDPDQLINWVRLYETGKTLDLNENYKTFANKLTESSNVTLYLKTGDMVDLASKYLSSGLASGVLINKSAVKDFEGILLQLINQSPYIYTNLYVKQSTTQHQEDIALWRVKLDDDMANKPYPVKDHTTGKYNIVVFDKSNQMYLIRYDGVILWKKQLSGNPISKVFQVDYFKNRKIQYLFNTSNFTYLFDKNGNNVKQYPLKINPSATNGLNIFDYNRKKDYRILIAQSDKRIYNYNIKGRKIKGWKSFKMPDIVVKPVRHLVANHKDYLIVTDINNNVKIVNRKGQERILINGRKLNKAINCNFYVNKTNSKGIFITTDNNGRLVYISAKGKLRYTDFGKFSPNHFFLYDDFNNDGVIDFIYVDGNKLTIFNRFKNVIFSYRFNGDIVTKPEFFNLSKRKKVLGIVSETEHKIYLFDENGKVTISKNLIGETPFAISDLQHNGEVNLIVGDRNNVLNYKLK